LLLGFSLLVFDRKGGNDMRGSKKGKNEIIPLEC